MTYYMKDTRHLGYSAGLYTILQDYILFCWIVFYSASTLPSAGAGTDDILNEGY